MTRFIHDQLAKGILEETLSLGGEVQVDFQIVAERQWVDVLFTPTRDPLPSILGLLGQLPPQVTTLFEPYRNAVNSLQILSCQNKLTTLIAERDREAKRQKRSLSFEQLPFLWILTPTASKRLLNSFGARSNPEQWPTGVYELPSGQRTGIIAIHQLPQRLDTLWLRLLGRDQVQQSAMEELRQLASDDPLRERVLELTYDFLAVLEARQRQEAEAIDPEDRVLFMQLSGLFQQRITEERRQGWEEGLQAGQRQMIEALLTQRFGHIDAQLQAIIEPLMALPSNESLSLLMELSEAELIEQFK